MKYQQVKIFVCGQFMNALITGFDQLIKKSIHNINEFFKLSPMTDGGAKKFLSQVDAFLIGKFHRRKGAFARNNFPQTRSNIAFSTFRMRNASLDKLYLSYIQTLNTTNYKRINRLVFSKLLLYKIYEVSINKDFYLLPKH